MGLIKCPDCGKIIRPFGSSKIEERAAKFGISHTVSIPIDPVFAELADHGESREAMLELFIGRRWIGVSLVVRRIEKRTLHDQIFIGSTIPPPREIAAVNVKELVEFAPVALFARKNKGHEPVEFVLGQRLGNRRVVIRRIAVVDVAELAVMSAPREGLPQR